MNVSSIHLSYTDHLILEEFGLDKKLTQKQCYLWIVVVMKTCAMIFEPS